MPAVLPATAAVNAFMLTGWPKFWPLPSLPISAMPEAVQPSLMPSVLAPPAVNAASVLISYGLSPLVGSVTEKVMTGRLPGVVGVALMMLNLNLADAALSRVGKLCATTTSAILPAPWHSTQVLLSVMTPPGCATV